MENQPSHPQSVLSTYIIRIWQDWSLGGTHWRGRIEYLQTGQRVAFEDLNQIVTFIRSSGSLPENHPGSCRQDDESGSVQ
jgi:hypothetical protein